jgi:hypothetical protein
MRLDDIYKKIQQLDEAMNEAASASINMSGDNAEDVIKLMNALKGGSGADSIDSIPTAIKKPVAPMPVMGPPDMSDDMAKLRDIVDGPKDRDQLKPGIQGEPCKICGKDHLGNSGCGEDIEEVVVGGNAKPEDPNSVYARLMGDLSEIQNGAMDDNDMADDIADELGDYLRNGDAPKGSHYEKAIGIVMDAIHDGPQAQADAAEEAISVLHSAEEESRGNNEDYANEPDESYQDQHYMTKDLSGGSEQGQKKSYPKAAGGDNPMALEAEIAKSLAAQLKTFMSEGKGCECNDGGSCDCDDSCEDCSCK